MFDSPHCVEIIIWRHVVFIVASESQLIAVALMYKVPELFRAEWLNTDYELRYNKSYVVNPEILQCVLGSKLNYLLIITEAVKQFSSA